MMSINRLLCMFFFSILVCMFGIVQFGMRMNRKGVTLRPDPECPRTSQDLGGRTRVSASGIEWTDTEEMPGNATGFDFTLAEMPNIVATWRRESAGLKWKPVDILGIILPARVPGYRNPCYHDTTFRCLPYFLIIGVEKCGSTELFNYVGTHPKIISPTIKESMWFNQRRMVGLNNLRSYSSYFKSGIIQKTKDAVTGEASVQYFTDNSMWMDVPENRNYSDPRVLLPHLIKHVVPDVRLVVTLRDPVERLWSDYWYYGRRKESVYVSSPEDFHERVVWGTAWLQECFRALPARHCLYDIPYRHRTQLQRFYYRGPFGHAITRIRVGLYSGFLEDWLTVFPREQMHFVTLDEFIANRTHVLEGIYQHLHLELPTPDHYHNISKRGVRLDHHNNHTNKPRMFSQTREILQKFYRPFNRKLAEMFGDKKYLWGY